MENKFNENKAKRIGELRQHIQQLQQQQQQQQREVRSDKSYEDLQRKFVEGVDMCVSDDCVYSSPSASSSFPLLQQHSSDNTVHVIDMAKKFTDKNFCQNLQMFINENSTSYPKSRRFPDEALVDSSCGGVEKVFKTLVRQSPPGSNEQVQGSFGGDNSIKISKPNSWYYYTPRTENFRNYYFGEKYRKPPLDSVKQELFKDIRHNLLSWKEKTRLKMKDKISIIKKGTT
jgi:hypothetical protein